MSIFKHNKPIIITIRKKKKKILKIHQPKTGEYIPPLKVMEHTATAQYHDFGHILIFKTMPGKIDANYKCKPASFKVRCMLNPILWRNPALSKTNVR